MPKGISIDQLHELPEEPGVYYFINEHNRVVYIGKAKNIKQRVFQHFNKATTKAAKLYQQVHEITFELTGNELVALLLEAHEIKTRQPEINKALRRTNFPYFIGSRMTEDGYESIHVLKASTKNLEKTKKLYEYSSLGNARNHLIQLIQEFNICQQHCHARGLEYNVCLLYTSPSPRDS